MGVTESVLQLLPAMCPLGRYCSSLNLHVLRLGHSTYSGGFEEYAVLRALYSAGSSTCWRNEGCWRGAVAGGPSCLWPPSCRPQEEGVHLTCSPSPLFFAVSPQPHSSRPSCARHLLTLGTGDGGPAPPGRWWSAKINPGTKTGQANHPGMRA